jgi:hypothetical protein
MTPYETYARASRDKFKNAFGFKVKELVSFAVGFIPCIPFIPVK